MPRGFWWERIKIEETKPLDSENTIKEVFVFLGGGYEYNAMDQNVHSTTNILWDFHFACSFDECEKSMGQSGCEQCCVQLYDGLYG
jgi:hypothetical protein